MKEKKVRALFMLLGWVLLASLSVQAQQAPSDMILVNGKIITVDNDSFTSNLGTIAQAMHVKDGKILHVGTNDQIRPMAGPNTKVIDLKGRTVIPGFILTHEHPWDWSPVTPAIVKKVLTDDTVIARIMDGSPEENLKAFPAALNEAVSKAKPGQWIFFMFTLGKNYQYSGGGNGGYGRTGFDPNAFNVLDGKRIPKEMLDAAAPNNPVLLRDVFTATIVNQKALDAAVAVFPDYRMNSLITPPPGMQRSGSPAASPMRWAFQDVMLKDHYDKLVEVMKLGLEWWAGYGMTAYASNAYAPSNLKVYRDLDAKGQMPIRNMWTWNWNPEYLYADPFFLTDVATRLNEGSDYLWFGGGVISTGAGCSTADPLPDSALAKYRAQQAAAGGTTGPQGSNCNYTPGSARAKLLYDYVKAGGRFVNLHTVGDKDIDNIMNIIIEASHDAGMTDDQIRAKRHGFDHTVMWPRPDQVPVMKRYNFMASSDAFEIYQASPAVMDYFGERVANWVVPNKRIVEGQIYNSFEMDRSLGSTDLTFFDGLSWLTGRKAWDGKVYAQEQRVDRPTALKIATNWGAYYVLRENSLGSLKPGKLADFVVLDRDYLTVPDADFAKTRVLMTVVGGKVIHLVPSLAREIGMQPAGAQVTLGFTPAQW
ncbi:MAG: amidohydrolase family protein [Acidobacteria bacterium]|nr:amidohydrolase family protein [Acidobacteriota bacterium]